MRSLVSFSVVHGSVLIASSDHFLRLHFYGKDVAD
jgi:hypothetical protein